MNQCVRVRPVKYELRSAVRVLMRTAKTLTSKQVNWHVRRGTRQVHVAAHQQAENNWKN